MIIARFARRMLRRLSRSDGRRYARKVSPWNGVAVVSDSYDPLTDHLSSLLQRTTQHAASASRISRHRSDRGHLVEWLSKCEGPRLLVFGGHGYHDGLLTSSDFGHPLCATDPNYAYLLRPEDVIAPVEVVAICCHAGDTFGRVLVERMPGSRFVGFNDEILFLLGSGPGVESLSQPHVAALRTILADGGLGQVHITRLREMYEERYQEWLHGSWSNRPEAPFVVMCLESYMDALVSHGVSS